MATDGGLRAEFRKRFPGAQWQSIETGGTGRGIPDSEYCFPGGLQGWIEYKQTDGWAVGISPEQVGWLQRRARMGGRAWLAVRQRAPQGPRRDARDVLWMVPGAMAGLVRADGLRPLADVPEVYWWGRGPRWWDWARVRDLLTRPLALLVETDELRS